jgi:biotin carboxyl carrier protein
MQYDKVEDDGIRYTFLHKGNTVKMSVYNEAQFKYKGYMPEVTKIDYAKSIMSPMPGAIVQVFVQPGDTVVEGQ